jgi:hypothetical protein
MLDTIFYGTHFLPIRFNKLLLDVVYIMFPNKLTIRNCLHTFSKICPKKSFVYHSFQQFIKAYRQKMRSIKSRV